LNILFLCAAAIFIYTFIGYPILLFILSLFFKKTVRKKDETPSVSLIISAYNEENVIKQKIENSLELDYPGEKIEIIVASESTDGTDKIVVGYKSQGVILFSHEGRVGKSATLYEAIPRTKGEIIIFSDANAMYKKDAIRKIVRNFSDPRIGCVSGRLTYVNSGRSNIGEGESAYWEFDFILKKLASRMFVLGGGVNGSIFAIRKEYYDPIDKYRGDDFEIANRIEINGHGVVLEPEAISYEESSTQAKQELKRKIRLASWNLKSSLILLGEALRKFRFRTVFLLFSHRFLRYTTPLWLMVILFSNLFLLSSAYKYIFYLQIIFYLFALTGFLFEKNRTKIPSVLLFPFYFCLVNYAALVAVFRTIFRKTQVVWEKVR
jgi:cellulose synthase/poly-beta-1,6-N-acetylglucosamine synthase-like glycosyltransferase